jgi:tetratricopeptide (TPR) repeat protein
MRSKAGVILAFILASTGCAGSSWLGRGEKPEEEQPSTIRQTLSQKGLPPTNPETRSKVQQPAKGSKQTGDIAQVSHNEPVDTKQSKIERSSENGGFTKRYSQARSFESSNKLEEARAIYQELIAQYPKRWEPYHRLGLVADRQRRFTEAESLLSEALRRKPLDPELFADLGYCYYLQGKLEKAESALVKAVSIKPSDARYRNNLGLVYGAQGRLEDALESFRHAGSEADAQYNMAFIMAMRNDMEGAKKRFQLALSIDPSHDGAYKALKSFQKAEREGDQEIEPEMTADGRRWVPYLEDASQLQAAGNSTATKALQVKARGMLQNRMAEGG